MSPPYHSPSQAHRGRWNRNASAENDSLDHTVALLTGFTPRQLESISQLVAARVDSALQQQQLTPPVTPTHGNLMAHRALLQQRSMNNLMSAASGAQLDSPSPQPSSNNHDGNQARNPHDKFASSRIPQPTNTSTKYETRYEHQTRPEYKTMGFSRPSRLHFEGPKTPSPTSPPPTPDFKSTYPTMNMNARDDHETQADLPSTKQACPSNGISTRDFQSLVRNNSSGLVVQHDVRYLALHPHLPPSAPRSHPHIIDYPTVSYTWSQTGLGLADLVVTVLYKYDPHILDLFLYSGKKKFEFRRKGPNKLTAVPFITREMKFVTVCLPFFPRLSPLHPLLLPLPFSSPPSCALQRPPHLPLSSYANHFHEQGRHTPPLHPQTAQRVNHLPHHRRRHGPLGSDDDPRREEPDDARSESAGCVCEGGICEGFVGAADLDGRGRGEI